MRDLNNIEKLNNTDINELKFLSCEIRESLANTEITTFKDLMRTSETKIEHIFENNLDAIKSITKLMEIYHKNPERTTTALLEKNDNCSASHNLNLTPGENHSEELISIYPSDKKLNTKTTKTIDKGRLFALPGSMINDEKVLNTPIYNLRNLNPDAKKALELCACYTVRDLLETPRELFFLHPDSTERTLKNIKNCVCRLLNLDYFDLNMYYIDKDFYNYTQSHMKKVISSDIVLPREILNQSITELGLKNKNSNKLLKHGCDYIGDLYKVTYEELCPRRIIDFDFLQDMNNSIAKLTKEENQKTNTENESILAGNPEYTIPGPNDRIFALPGNMINDEILDKSICDITGLNFNAQGALKLCGCKTVRDLLETPRVLFFAHPASKHKVLKELQTRVCELLNLNYLDLDTYYGDEEFIHYAQSHVKNILTPETVLPAAVLNRSVTELGLKHNSTNRLLEHGCNHISDLYKVSYAGLYRGKSVPYSFIQDINTALEKLSIVSEYDKGTDTKKTLQDSKVIKQQPYSQMVKSEDSRNKTISNSTSSILDPSKAVEEVLYNAEDAVREDEIRKKVERKYKCVISNEKIREALENNDRCYQWYDHGYIHFSKIPWEGELLAKITERILETFHLLNTPIINVSSIFGCYQDILINNNIPSKWALYSMLKDANDSRISVREFPWICSAKIKHNCKNLDEYLVITADNSGGFISNAYLNDLASKVSLTPSQVRRLMDKSDSFSKVKNGWQKTVHSSSNSDLDSFLGQIESGLKENEIISSTTLFNNSTETCLQLDIGSDENLYKVLESNQKDRNYKTIGSLCITDKQNQIDSIEQALYQFLKTSLKPIQKIDLDEEFAVNKQIDISKDYKKLLKNDNVIIVGEDLLCSKENTNINIEFIKEFNDSLKIALTHCAKISDTYYEYDSVIAQLKLEPPVPSIEWNKYLIEYLFNQDNKFVMLGENNDCIVHLEESPQIYSIHRLVESLLLKEFGGSALFSEFKDYCSYRKVIKNITKDFIDNCTDIETDGVFIEAK